MFEPFAVAVQLSAARRLTLACVVWAALVPGERPAYAQGRDSPLNGAVIGGAVGAGLGIGLTHATRDSELGFSQYAQGALIFGAIGAGAGVCVDALLNRSSLLSGGTRRPVLIAPAVWRHVAGVVVKWRW